MKHLDFGFKEVVTWGLLIWLGSELTAQSPPTPADQRAAGACSYGFYANQQSSVTAPYWMRRMGQPVKPWIFQAGA